MFLFVQNSLDGSLSISSLAIQEFDRAFIRGFIHGVPPIFLVVI